MISSFIASILLWKKVSSAMAVAGAVGDVPLAGRGAVLHKSLEAEVERRDERMGGSECGYVVGTAVVMGIAMARP